MTDPSRLVIRRPDDWHVHLRDGDMLEAVAGHTARQFARAIVMPNLAPPVISVAAAEAYRDPHPRRLARGERLHAADDLLSDRPRRRRRRSCAASKRACSRPASSIPPTRRPIGAQGVTDVRSLAPALEAMQRIGMPLLVHGEVTDPEVDIFDREAVFIERVLAGLARDFPALKIVFEHITTAEAVAFVEGAGPNRRRDRHSAPSRHQPQRDVRRRPPPACLLPAGGEARAAPAGGAPRRHLGLGEILPRHRQRPACA